jgi:DNA-binding XRE family transcriptional regulator
MAKKSNAGRPTDYKQEYVELVYKLALLGATDREMADIIGVKEQTLNNWKKEHPEFFESIKEGKEIADAKVAESLYNRANGYTCPETKAQWVHDDSGGHWEYAEMRKHYPPDTQAASLWLRNRQKAKWRDKIEAELTGKDGGPIETKWEIFIHDGDAPA